MIAPLIDAALRYMRAGYIPLRLEPESKAAKSPGWQTTVPTEDGLTRAFARPSNLGIRTGDRHADGSRLLAIDVDLEEGELIRCVERAIGRPAPCKQGKKGFTYLCRIDKELRTHKLHWYRGGAKRPAIDILCVGAQTVVPPSIHPETRLPYRWVAGTPLDQCRYDELPLFSEALIDEIAGFCKNADDPIYKLNDMEWHGVGGGGDTHDTCLAAVASMVARGWTDEDIHARIDRAKREACEAAGMAYDWPEAQKIIQGWIDSARAKFGGSGKVRKLSHGALADAFIEEVRPHVRYDWDKGSWYRYLGNYWMPNQIHGLRHAIERYLPAELRNRAQIEGIEKSLRDRPELSVLSSEWDPDPHLLNTPAGTVDLRTGLIRPSAPEDMITRCTNVGPDAVFEDALWLRKLEEWFGDDPQELGYHQTLAGYFCTGETHEHCLPLWIGPGGDGKSVITGAYAQVLGNYGGVATDTVFLDNRHSQHSEELAMLCGYRMVRVSEMSGMWREDRIKQVTGGESVTAAFKHAHLFTFTPTFKLLVTANEPPRLRSVGKDMGRRFHVCKFTRTVKDVDPYLAKKLEREGAKILGWMIAGAVKYYAGGLTRSPAVVAATSEYFYDNDSVLQWREECAELGADFRVAQGAAYESYRGFMEIHGHRHIPTRTTFQNRLMAMGVLKKNAVLHKGGSPVPALVGIRLKDLSDGEMRAF